MSRADSDAIITFLRLAARLKSTPRQGWLDRGIPQPESAADHSWSVAICAWLIALGRAELDAGRVLLLALIHDLPEALVGDATPFDQHRSEDGSIPAEHFRAPPVYDERAATEKHARERAALIQMTAGLPPELSVAVVDAWDEYASGTTPEARFVRQLDKLETLLQAELYLEDHPGIVIDSFRLGTDRDVTDPELRRLLKALAAAAPATRVDTSGP